MWDRISGFGMKSRLLAMALAGRLRRAISHASSSE